MDRRTFGAFALIFAILMIFPYLNQKFFPGSPRPEAPDSTVVVNQEPMAGHYRLNWTEPGDAKVRYYNVYYSTAGNPVLSGNAPIDQSLRIASLPVGTDTYLDWLADPNTAGFYGLIIQLIQSIYEQIKNHLLHLNGITVKGRDS